MTLQSSANTTDPLKFSEIQAEFNLINSNRFRNFLNASIDIPASGTLKFSDFLGKTYGVNIGVLLVGGGGGGGGGSDTYYGVGGGGGGGGIIGYDNIKLPPDTYTVTIGAGGAGGPQDQNAEQGISSFILKSTGSLLEILGAGGGGAGAAGTPSKYNSPQNGTLPLMGNRGAAGAGGAYFTDTTYFYEWNRAELNPNGGTTPGIGDYVMSVDDARSFIAYNASSRINGNGAGARFPFPFAYPLFDGITGFSSSGLFFSHGGQGGLVRNSFSQGLLENTTGPSSTYPGSGGGGGAWLSQTSTDGQDGCCYIRILNGEGSFSSGWTKEVVGNYDVWSVTSAGSYTFTLYQP